MICSEAGPRGFVWPARIGCDSLPGPEHSRQLKVRLSVPNLTLGSPHSQAAENL